MTGLQLGCYVSVDKVCKKERKITSRQYAYSYVGNVYIFAFYIGEDECYLYLLIEQSGLLWCTY